MRALEFFCRATSLCIGALMLARCGGAVPIGSAASISGAALPAMGATRSASHSWMAPEARHDDLLYVSEYGGGVVDVFSYPKGAQVGALSGFSSLQGECVDAKGNVWILSNDTHPGAAEFAHGGTSPIASVSDSGQEPYGCAIDPTTGNLAISNQSGNVAIYASAQGTPKLIADGAMVLGLWCGYDNQGNLFFDGLNGKIESQLAEVPKNGSLTNLTLNGSLGFPGNIQWDGSSVTIDDVMYQSENTSAVDRLQISGSSASIIGTTPLVGSEEVFGTWIQGKTIVAPEEEPNEAVDFWPYPKSGDAKKHLTKSSGFFNGAFGTVVSK
jgi:hypothetical protein